MKKISIIGAAGTLGAAIAFTLANNRKINELCLIDVKEDVLLNHVMDLQNAYPYKEIYKGAMEDMKRSGIVIISAGVSNRNTITSRHDFLKDNLKIVKQAGKNIQQYAPSALIVTASNPVDILNYYLFKNFSFKPEQLIGYTMNDSFRFEWVLRTVLECSEEDTLETPVIGEHGDSQVPVFSKVRKNGQKLELPTDVYKQVQKRLLNWFGEYNALKVNRTTGWTTARGMDSVIDKLLSSKPSKMIGSAILHGEYGIKQVSLGAPLLVNLQGILEVREWGLTREEQKKYHKSANLIRGLIEQSSDYEY
ncbi:malate dehydrogenase [Salibacterium aidingense]|uniref:malate dehydrogenase n=1 Tax=Salibacterium aidingense TaxID=384933 RepID=UPI003BC6FB20